MDSESRDDRRAPWGRGTILVADDHTPTCETIRKVLTHHGFSLVDVRDGEAAIQAFHAFGRDIVAVLMDHKMPRLLGPEACEAIQMMAPDTPIISLSPLEDPSGLYRRGLLRAHLQLPCRPEDLLATLRLVLKA